MADREQLENRIIQILLILLALTMLSFWMLGNLYAKYATSSENSDQARVARFSVLDTNDMQETYEIHPSLTGSQVQQIKIRVTSSSDVAVRYTFSIDLDGNLPIRINGEDGLEKQSNANIWTTEKTAGASGDETYTFTMSLENEADSYQYAGGVESIVLTVKAEQID